MIKKGFFLFFIIVFLFGLVCFSFGASRDLEVEYIEIAGEKPTSIGTSQVPRYFRYVYYFFIAVCGFIILGVLISAGFNYLTSYGNPEKLNNAKSQIVAAILGAIILFFSWLILNTINPQLVVFDLHPTLPVTPTLGPGVYICKFPGETQKMKEVWDLQAQFSDFNYLFLKGDLTPEEEEMVLRKLQEISDQINEKMDSINAYCAFIDKSKGIGTSTMYGWKYICFVPEREIKELSTAAEIKTVYGAIVKGSTKEMRRDGSRWGMGSVAYIEHIFSNEDGPVCSDYVQKIAYPTILPFIVIKEGDEKTVSLYEYENRNKKIPTANIQDIVLSSHVTIKFDNLTFSPLSIEVPEETIVMLSKDFITQGNVGSSYVFKPGVYNNLLAYDPLSDWKVCEIERHWYGDKEKYCYIPAAKCIMILRAYFY